MFVGLLLLSYGCILTHQILKKKRQGNSVEVKQPFITEIRSKLFLYRTSIRISNAECQSDNVYGTNNFSL